MLKSRTNVWVQVCSVALILGCLVPPFAANSQAPSNETGSEPTISGQIHALARLEPASGVFSVGARPGARIETIHAKLGETVKTGETLAVLDGNQAARAQLALAEAERKVAKGKLARERARLAVKRERENKILVAKKAAVAPDVFVAKQRFDEIKASYAKLGSGLQAKDRLDADMAYYQAELQNIKATLDYKEFQINELFLSRARALEDEELAPGGANDEVLDRQVELAAAQVEQTVLKAPVSGRILSVTAHAGEVSSGPIVVMGDTSTMVAHAEVDQSDIMRIRMGAGADVSILGKKVRGKVTQIGSLVGANQIRNVDPRAPLDLRVLKVTIQLDDNSSAADLVNLQVDVAIEP